MKKFILLSMLLAILSSCGVGNYTISSGISDEARISFTLDEKIPITVIVDDVAYEVNTVKTKAYKSDRNIKETERNCIRLSSGQHMVKVILNDNLIFEKKLLLSQNEHRVIEL